MGILQPNENKKDEKTIDFTLVSSKNLLLIFTRNPELGKGKRRLATTVGDKATLEIYKFLLNHTAEITKNLYAQKTVYYSEEIWKNDVWDDNIYNKKIQVGKDLGERMANAFLDGFSNGFDKIIIIGSDMYDLSLSDLENAFKSLENHDYVVGPAEDGGYYLLGMKSFKKELFINKNWGTSSVLQNTLNDIKKGETKLLEPRNDVDYYEDIKDIDAFDPFLKHIKE